MLLIVTKQYPDIKNGLLFATHCDAMRVVDIPVMYGSNYRAPVEHMRVDFWVPVYNSEGHIATPTSTMINPEITHFSVYQSPFEKNLPLKNPLVIFHLPQEDRYKVDQNLNRSIRSIPGLSDWSYYGNIFILKSGANKGYPTVRFKDTLSAAEADEVQTIIAK